MKSDWLLLQKIAIQLEKWSHDPETHGRQHQPMSVLANEIFSHLASRDGLVDRCFTYRGCNFYKTKKCNRACGNYPPTKQPQPKEVKVIK